MKLNVEQQAIVNRFIEALEVIRKNKSTRYFRDETNSVLKSGGAVSTSQYQKDWLTLCEAREALRTVLGEKDCGMDALTMIGNHPNYVVSIYGKRISVTFGIEFAGDRLPVEYRIAGYAD